jgi:hypothetical protein
MTCKIEVFTAVTTKNAVFWDVMLRDSCKSRHFGGKCRLHHQGDKNQQATNVSRFVVLSSGRSFIHCHNATATKLENDDRLIVFELYNRR